MKKTVKLRICKSASSTKGWMLIIASDSAGLVIFTHRRMEEVQKFAGKLFNRQSVKTGDSYDENAPHLLWKVDFMNDYETSIEVTAE